MVVFKSYPLETGSMFLVRSFDGGATVQDILEIEHQQNGVAWLPSLEMDDLGNPHIIYMGHDQNWTNPHYYLLHSNDLGALFSVAQNITTSIPEEACDCCPAELVLSENKQVLLYRNNNQNLRDIFGVYSNDNGQNFSSSTNLESLDWLVMSCPSTAPDGIIIQDTLWSVSASKASGSYRIYLSKASLNSQIVPLYTDTLLGPSQQSGNQNHPRIKASSEYIAVTWHENAGTNYDVFVAVAPSNQPLALYDSKINVSENLSGNQIYSDVAVLGNKIHLVYQDNSTGSVIYRSGTINLTNQLNNTNQSMLTLLPNPVSDICNVSASSPIKRIRLFDQSGKYLATYHFNGKQATEQLHLHLLQAGSYFILIETNSGQEKLSFMKI